MDFIFLLVDLLSPNTFLIVSSCFVENDLAILFYSVKLSKFNSLILLLRLFSSFLFIDLFVDLFNVDLFNNE